MTAIIHKLTDPSIKPAFLKAKGIANTPAPILAFIY